MAVYTQWVKSFRAAVRSGKFALTAELSLNPHSGAEDVRVQAAVLESVVDAIQVTDNPNAQVQMSSLAASAVLLNSGYDAIPQITCRDRNRVALKSELLGAWALGVTSLLLMRGEPLGGSAAPDAKAVFDVTGQDLIAIAQAIRNDRELNGAPDFLIGGVATVFNPAKNWLPDRLFEKIEAGVKFFQTQPCFNIEMLRKYMARLIDAGLMKRAHFVVGTIVLPGPGTARWVRDYVRGSVMPDETIERMEQASDPEQEGITICAELLAELKDIPGVSGANLMTPGNFETMSVAIKESKIDT